MRRTLRVATTATLAVACVVLSVMLWQARREIQRPAPGFHLVLEGTGDGGSATASEIRGGAGAETGRAVQNGSPLQRAVYRPPRGHRLLLTLALPDGVTPRPAASEVVWAAEILPPPGEGPGYVERASAVLRNAVQIELAPDPAPGSYRVNLYRFAGSTPERVARYGYRIGLPEEDPPEEAPAAASRSSS